MKYCRNCNLKINNKHDKCLFCGSSLEVIDDEYLSSFPTKKPKAYYIDRVKKIILFSLLILILVSGLLNYYLFKDREYWFLVSFSSIYVYFVSSISLNFSKGIVAKISNISILTSLEVIGVFLFFNLDFKGICLTYVFPGICLISLISMVIIYLLTKGKHVHDQLIYIFINSVYGFIPFILVLFKVIEVTFVSSITSMIALLILIAFLIFVDKDSKDELKRRFHI